MTINVSTEQAQSCWMGARAKASILALRAVVGGPRRTEMGVPLLMAWSTESPDSAHEFQDLRSHWQRRQLR